MISSSSDEQQTTTTNREQTMDGHMAANNIETISRAKLKVDEFNEETGAIFANIFTKLKAQNNDFYGNRLNGLQSLPSIRDELFEMATEFKRLKDVSEAEKEERKVAKSIADARLVELKKELERIMNENHQMEAQLDNNHTLLLLLRLMSSTRSSSSTTTTTTSNSNTNTAITNTNTNTNN